MGLNKKTRCMIFVLLVFLVVGMGAKPQSFGYAQVNKGSELPAKPKLRSDDSWAQDGNYTILMNMDWGTNGTSWKLYENGKVVYSKKLTDNSPHPQFDEVSFKNKPPGTYTYRAELINDAGSTMSDSLTIEVKAFPPGKTRISHDNYDHDGNYTITMNMDYGPNATSWKLYENGEVIYTHELTADSPNAQSDSVSITDKPPGTYTYQAELINKDGSTMSNTITVTVKAFPPGEPTLSSDNYNNTRNYTITMHKYSGPDASSWKLYEDGKVVYSHTLEPSTSGIQSDEYRFSNKAPGIYTYKAELINKDGSTMSKPITVKVNPPQNSVTLNFDAMNFDSKIGETTEADFFSNGGSVIDHPQVIVKMDTGYNLYISGEPFRSLDGSATFSINRLNVSVGNGSSQQTYPVGSSTNPVQIDTSDQGGTYFRTIDFSLNLTLFDNPYSDNKNLIKINQERKKKDFSTTIVFSLTRL